MRTHLWESGARGSYLFLCVGGLAAMGLAVGMGCDPPPRRARDAGSDATLAGDRDGDTIRDADEGIDRARDTDGDGTLDALDVDADEDGLRDELEAGDASPQTPPIDSDGDGEPDFVDVDADGNGIGDRDEGTSDSDGDGRLDAHSRDDDGDSLSDLEELHGTTLPPRDSDRDGVPDHRDTDSDGDHLSDATERSVDTDGDGVVDRLDLDSDEDGILDGTEAGDPPAPPPDTDGDGALDFRDPDSDDDGLSDRDEAMRHHTSPVRADSDGDGASDLIEVAAGTDPALDTDHPEARGDFVFVTPYRAAPTPGARSLTFRTRIQLADLYFLFDRSGSMSGEIAALRGAVTTLLTRLTCATTSTACEHDVDCADGEICGVPRTCIEDPAFRGCVASPSSGVGWYLGDYVNVLGIQPDPTRTAAALELGVTGATESLYRALWGIADPVSAPGIEGACVAGGIGCPAFRVDATRIVVAFTDEDSDGTESVADTSAALSAAGIDVIGVWSGGPSSPERGDLVEVVRGAGTLDRVGAAMVFDGADDAVVDVVQRAIVELVAGTPMRVTIEASDVADDAGDALALLDRLEANGASCGGLPTLDGDGDGVDDTFPAVTPGVEVCFDVVPATNDSVQPLDVPQLFRARLDVRGDGSLLDSRDVYFLVPPRPPSIEVPE